MVSKLLVFGIFVSIASQCLAMSKERAVFEAFERRQSVPISPSQIPSACSSTCAPISSVVNSCETLACLCNNTVAAEIATCIDCIVGVSNDTTSSTQSQSQSLIDQYVNACDTSGEPISSIIVSSVLPSGSGSQSTATAPSSTNSANPSTSSSSSSDTRTRIDVMYAMSALAGVVVAFLLQ